MASFRRLAVIGGGRMGQALVAGLLESGMPGAENIAIAEPVASRREELASLGVEVVASAPDAVRGADAVLLAVKPQVIDAVVGELAQALDRGALVISIAAGVSTSHLGSLLPDGTPVVRVMPNTPAMVRAGMSAVSGGSSASVEQVEAVRAMLSAVGEAVVVEEVHQDAVTAVSGSGPAYVAAFIDALVEGGVREGLPHEVAMALALRTVAGTAALLDETGQTPSELIEAVSSPGGTTVAGLSAMEAGGFRETVIAGVSAAASRSKELGS